MAFRRIPIPKPGVLFGTTKVLRRLQKHAWDSLDMYEVECVCGRVSCIGYCALKAHYHGEALGCHWCRWDDGKAKREKVTVPCKGCGRKLRRIRSTAPMAMCKPCAKRVQRSTNKRYRNSQRGRRCIGCRRTDAQTQWPLSPVSWRWLLLSPAGSKRAAFMWCAFVARSEGFR